MFLGRLRLGGARLNRDRLVRGGLVVALLVAVAGVAFGAGYRGSQAMLGDGSAYVQKGHTVVHVNAESGQADAKAARDLATGRQRLEIVQVRPGVVYVVNNETDQVWELPTDTMRPGAVAAAPTGTPPAAGPSTGGRPAAEEPARPSTSGDPGRAQLVAGGGVAYLLDVERGALSLLDGRRTTPVDLPSRVDDAVVDGAGTAWALSRADGVLYAIGGTQLRRQVTVSVPGEAARLTLAADRPVVLVPERNGEGLVRVIGEGVRHPEIVVAAQPDGALRVARPGADAPVLAAVVQRDDTVVTVDFATGEEQHLQLTGRDGARSYGRPVVARGHVYVPDFTQRQVVVLALKPLRQLRAVPVPGPGGTFDVFARDGRVWANDPYARTLLSFTGADWTDADKGPGDGVVGSEPEPSAPPTTAPSAAAPPVRPTGRPTGPAPAPSRTRPAPPRTTSPPPPRLVEVPAVAGLDEAAACARITGAELRCAPPATQQQTGCQTGLALSSNPPARSRVRPGTAITVVLCGPTAVPGPLAGTHVDTACRTVEASGLVCARRDGGPAGSPAQVGLVSRQSPTAGTPVPNGSTVELWFFTGVVVPQITGVSPGAACGALQAQGLLCAPNPEEVTWEANVVHGQSIPAGTPVALGTAVGYVYQDTAPVDLHRWKLHNVEVRYLSTGGPPPGDWRQQPDIGGVYGTGGGVPGLVTVYQHRCVRDCLNGRPTGYYYSQNPNPPNGRWALDGAAFTCFGGAVPGTKRLMAMYHDGWNSWAFAPENSGEYDTHWASGYRPQFVICHLFHGVPGFP